MTDLCPLLRHSGKKYDKSQGDFSFDNTSYSSYVRNMKIIYTLMIGIGLIMPAFSGRADTQTFFLAPQKQAIETKQSISFMGDTYTFEYGDEIQNEYFTNGETIDGFSSLIAVHIFKNHTDPLFVAQGFYDKLLADNQVARLAIHRFSKEPTLTFILTSPQGFELNLWRFYRNPNRDEVIGMQYLKTFKTPQTQAEKDRLKSLIQIISEQFAILPKIPFIR